MFFSPSCACHYSLALRSRMARTKQTARAQRITVVVFDPQSGRFHFDVRNIAVYNNNIRNAISRELGLPHYEAIDLQSPVSVIRVFDQRESEDKAPECERNKDAERIINALDVKLINTKGPLSHLYGRVIITETSAQPGSVLSTRISTIVKKMESKREDSESDSEYSESEKQSSDSFESSPDPSSDASSREDQHRKQPARKRSRSASTDILPDSKYPRIETV